jgi:hypothetical protein
MKFFSILDGVLHIHKEQGVGRQAVDAVADHTDGAPAVVGVESPKPKLTLAAPVSDLIDSLETLAMSAIEKELTSPQFISDLEAWIASLKL